MHILWLCLNAETKHSAKGRRHLSVSSWKHKFFVLYWSVAKDHEWHVALLIYTWICVERVKERKKAATLTLQRELADCIRVYWISEMWLCNITWSGLWNSFSSFSQRCGLCECFLVSCKCFWWQRLSKVVNVCQSQKLIASCHTCLIWPQRPCSEPKSVCMEIWPHSVISTASMAAELKWNFFNWKMSLLLRTSDDIEKNPDFLTKSFCECVVVSNDLSIYNICFNWFLFERNKGEKMVLNT